jgi:hypothetical protein
MWWIDWRKVMRDAKAQKWLVEYVEPQPNLRLGETPLAPAKLVIERNDLLREIAESNIRMGNATEYPKDDYCRLCHYPGRQDHKLECLIRKCSALLNRHLESPRIDGDRGNPEVGKINLYGDVAKLARGVVVALGMCWMLRWFFGRF